MKKGLYVHDVIGAYVESRHTPEQLRELQLTFINAMFEACPTEGGWNSRANNTVAPPGDEIDWFVGRSVRVLAPTLPFTRIKLHSNKINPFTSPSS